MGSISTRKFGDHEQVQHNSYLDLGFNSHCWPCTDESGKLLIWCCFCPSSSSEQGSTWWNEKQTEFKCSAIVAENMLNSPQWRWDRKRACSNTRGVITLSIDLTGISNMYIYIYFTLCTACNCIIPVQTQLLEEYLLTDITKEAVNATGSPVCSVSELYIGTRANYCTTVC